MGRPKPVGPVGPNPGHPLCPASAWLFAEGGGGLVRDAGPRLDHGRWNAAGVSAPLGPSYTPNGFGQPAGDNFGNNSSYVATTAKFLPTWTLFGRVRLDSGAAIYNNVFSASGGGFYVLITFLSGKMNLWSYGEYAGQAIGGFWTTYAPIGSYNTFSLVRKGDNVTGGYVVYYGNSSGGMVQSGTLNTTALAAYPTNPAWIGSRSDGAGQHFYGGVDYLLWYPGTALSARQIGDLYADPFQWTQPPARRVFAAPGGSTVFRDAGSPAEWTRISRRDGPHPADARGGVRVDRPAPAESLAALARDARGPAEAAATVLRSAPVPAEWLLTGRTDRRLPAEAAGSARRDQSAPVELAGAVRRDHPASIESISSVRRDGRIAAESIASTRADRPTAGGWLVSVRRDSPALTDSRGYVSHDAGSPGEWTGSVRTDRRELTDWRVSVAAIWGEPTEWLAVVRADPRELAEWTGSTLQPTGWVVYGTAADPTAYGTAADPTATGTAADPTIFDTCGDIAVAANTSQQQTWGIYADGDNQIVLAFTGSFDPSAATLAFYVARTDGGTPISGLAPTVAVSGVSLSGGVYTATITVGFTAAQMTTYLPRGSYFAALRRTDAGSSKPLAGRRLDVLSPGPMP